MGKDINPSDENKTDHLIKKDELIPCFGIVETEYSEEAMIGMDENAIQ